MPTSNRPVRLALLSALLLSACERAPTTSGAQQTAQATDPKQVECAIGGAAAFERSCTLDRTRSAKGLVLTLSAPSGSFRRLLVTGDGRGLVPADGAERAIIRVIGPGLVEVTVGPDRYRLPARLKGQAPASHA